MELMERLKRDAQAAVKAGDRDLANTLKYLYSLLQTEQARGNEFNAIKVLQKEMKSKKEALKMFEKAGRDDLIEKEEGEIRILNKYLPEMMNKDEIETLVDETVAELEDVDFGTVMGRVMSAVKGKAEGSLVAEIVREKLS